MCDSLKINSKAKSTENFFTINKKEIYRDICNRLDTIKDINSAFFKSYGNKEKVDKLVKMLIYTISEDEKQIEQYTEMFNCLVIADAVTSQKPGMTQKATDDTYTASKIMVGLDIGAKWLLLHIKYCGELKEDNEQNKILKSNRM
jgi:hypothetical protein